MRVSCEKWKKFGKVGTRGSSRRFVEMIKGTPRYNPMAVGFCFPLVLTYSVLDVNVDVYLRRGMNETVCKFA